MRGNVELSHLATRFVAATEASSEAMAAIEPALRTFCDLFGYDLNTVLDEKFWVVQPFSHKPFASKYAPNP